MTVSKDVAVKIIDSTLHSDVDTASFDYMKEVAFGFESGGLSEVIRKWHNNVYIKLHAVNNDGTTTTPNASDFAELQSIVSELNELITTIDIVLLTGGSSDECVSETHAVASSGTCSTTGYPKPNINLYITTRSRWATISGQSSGTVSGLNGQFLVGASSTSITSARCWVISSASEEIRKSLIREEITQPLGFGKDSATHSDSIFYEDAEAGEFGNNTAFSQLDKNIIRMVYDRRLKGGETVAQAEEILKKPFAVVSGESYEFNPSKTQKITVQQNKLDARFEDNNEFIG
tara:strand:+ start:439 stop:1308 length:870 start_codon:yes stop_codon:yes gene_type:complete